ncbi:nucleotidyltransferase family protein [Falsiroseomonas oryziterrae]|uniref:nucleotidyltransferase family protein n=1 Tax=Falsiroseomonas oryziterrae TaxID=2911368 RepID=UPI001F40B709|nr:nucleotidyltransferase family protein [Roseomonas sp. NPKOSM-4]
MGEPLLRALAASFATPPDTAILARLSPEDWAELVALAHRHRLVPALHLALTTRMADAAVPPEVRDHAGAIAALNDARNTAVQAEIRSAIAALNGAGLEPVMLKGAAILLEGGHAARGRMIGDIDLLVPTAREDEALAALGAAGFRPISEYPPSSHSIADLDRPGGHACLDLHRDLLDPPFRHLLPAADVLARAVPRKADGLRWHVPALTHRALHTLLHAQILSAGYYVRRLDLGAARDITALGDDVDWTGVEAWADRHRMRPILDAMLLAAGDGFGMPWPLRTSPGEVALAHHRRACQLEREDGRWDSGLGLLARLRESVAADRLDAAFGTDRTRPAQVALQLASVARRHRAAELLRRLLR